MFDTTQSGLLPLSMMRQILKTKHVPEADINDMIEGKQNQQNNVLNLRRIFQNIEFTTKISMKVKSTTTSLFQCSRCNKIIVTIKSPGLS